MRCDIVALDERFAAEESEGATLFCVALTPPSPVGRGFFTFYFARSELEGSGQFTFFRNSNPLKVSYTRTPPSPPMERPESTVPVLNSRPSMGSRLTTVIWMSL